MSAMPFTLIAETPVATPRRDKLALRLRQAELRHRAACMKVYAARLEHDAAQLDAHFGDEPSILPAYDLEVAQREVREFALEAERLRKELGL